MVGVPVTSVVSMFTKFLILTAVAEKEVVEAEVVRQIIEDNKVVEEVFGA